MAAGLSTVGRQPLADVPESNKSRSHHSATSRPTSVQGLILCVESTRYRSPHTTVPQSSTQRTPGSDTRTMSNLRRYRLFRGQWQAAGRERDAHDRAQEHGARRHITCLRRNGTMHDTPTLCQRCPAILLIARAPSAKRTTVQSRSGSNGSYTAQNKQSEQGGDDNDEPM